MEVMTINKSVKLGLLLLSYVILLIALYKFTDILKGTSINDTLFMIVSTTSYSYFMSAIEKETFRIKFSWLGTAFYIEGVAGFIVCSFLNQNSVIIWILSFLSTASLITGVFKSNGL